MNDPEFEQWEKERAERRKQIPNIKITLPLDMAELIAQELEAKSEWVGIDASELQPYECYDEFVKQVKLQKKKLKPS